MSANNAIDIFNNTNTIIYNTYIYTPHLDIACMRTCSTLYTWIYSIVNNQLLFLINHVHNNWCTHYYATVITITFLNSVLSLHLNFTLNYPQLKKQEFILVKIICINFNYHVITNLYSVYHKRHCLLSNRKKYGHVFPTSFDVAK